MGVATDSFIQKPHLSLFLGFIIAIAYVPGWFGASIPTAWLVLIIVMPIIFCFCELELNLVNVLGGLFIIFVTLSLFWTQNFNIGFLYFLEIIALSCVFCFGSNLNSLENCFKGLALGLGVSSIIAFLQRFTEYKFIFTIGNDVVGLFVNPNIYSEVSALMLISLLVMKLYWWIPVTLPGLILIQSRTAFVGLGVGLFFWLLNKNKRYAILAPIGIAIVTYIFYRNSFSFSTIDERFALWKDTLRGLTLFGSGVGSYEIYYPLNAIFIDTTISRPKFAHNDLLQSISEFGIFSLPLMLMIVAIFKIKSEFRIILITVGTMSLFTYSLHVPMEIFIACIVAGYITGHNASYWNIGNSWGSTLLTWFKNRRYGLYKIS